MFSRLKFRQADFSHKVQGSYFISTLHIFFTYFCFKTHFLTDPIRSNFELAPEAEMSLNGGVGFEWEGKAEGVTLSQCVTPQPQFPPRIFDKVHTQTDADAGQHIRRVTEKSGRFAVDNACDISHSVSSKLKRKKIIIICRPVEQLMFGLDVEIFC